MISLKEAISVKHREAEQHPFNKHLMSGKVTEEEYYVYLVQQLAIFDVIERFPLSHPSLTRSDSVLMDIDELTTQSIHVIIKSTREYTDYLHTLTQEQLLPHVYLNYFALVFGGQMMKDKVPGQGRLYYFDNMEDIVMSIRSIQQDEWADEVNKGFNYIIGIFNELQIIFGLFGGKVPDNN